jgi:nitrogen regulatory protein P-II 1
MRYVIAIIPPDRYDAVIDSLSAHHVRGVTVTEAMGFGQEHDPSHPEHAERLGVEMSKKLRLEIVCRTEEVEEILQALYDAGHTGRRGDGKVFVLPIYEALRLKTGERGLAALGPAPPPQGHGGRPESG